MATYNRIAKTVEAIQWNGENFAAILELIGSQAQQVDTGIRITITENIYIFAKIGDWVVLDGDANVYVYSNASFTATYEGLD
jgi:DNA-binding transcriptional regulator/RsmH inhibitor MraZ